MGLSGGIALCVAAATIRDVDEIRQRVDNIISLLEAVLEQGDAMPTDSPEKRRCMTLLRLAVEQAQLNASRLGAVEQKLGDRVRSQAELSYAVACADLGSRRCCR